MPNPLKEPDFSLMVGGPLYQFLIRSHLMRPPLALLRRRLLVLPTIARLPLLILAAIDGRLLVALPLLFALELPFHQRLRSTLRQVIQRNLVPADRRAQFDATVERALRLHNSPLLEVTGPRPRLHRRALAVAFPDRLRRHDPVCRIGLAAQRCPLRDPVRWRLRIR